MTPQLFVHIGDIHLAHHSSRNADRLQALDQIIRENEGCDFLSAWLIPGDVFDAKSSIDDRNTWASFLTRMGAVAPIVKVRGNHDAVGDLQIFQRLKTRWPVYVLERPGVIEVPLPRGEVAACACLPYPDKFGLVSAGVVPGDVPQTATELLDVVFMRMAHDLQVARDSGAIPLFLGHVNVRGSIASTGQPQIGKEQEIDRASLDRLPVVYRALSHIHAPQEVGSGVYAGSIIANDYGEAEAKSYVLVEVTRQADGIWTGEWRRVPIATPKMFHVTGRVDPTGFYLPPDCDEEIARRCCQRDWAGCDVRLRYSYKTSEKPALPSEDAIREHFTGALRFKIEGVAVPDRELRSPAVAAARTLPEKLAAYRQVETLDGSIAEKLSALQQQTPEQLLESVAASLAEIERPQEARAA